MAERVASSARSIDSSAARSARCLVSHRAPPNTTTTTNAVERKIFAVSPDSGNPLIPPPAGGVGLAELVEVLHELVAARVELKLEPAQARRPHLHGLRRKLRRALVPRAQRVRPGRHRPDRKGAGAARVGGGRRGPPHHAPAPPPLPLS